MQYRKGRTGIINQNKGWKSECDISSQDFSVLRLFSFFLRVLVLSSFEKSLSLCLKIFGLKMIGLGLGLKKVSISQIVNMYRAKSSNN